jgi:hypothetical protein
MMRWMPKGSGAVLVASAVLLGALGALPSGPAGASSRLALDWTVSATTHLSKLNMNVTPPPGTFKGKVNLKNGRITGHLSLPPAHTTIAVAGLGLVTATFEVKTTRPVTGTLDLSTLQVSTTSTFRVLVPSVTPAGLPVNLAPAGCATATPVTLSLGGKASLTGPSRFSGSYTIPAFAHCGALTVPFDALVSGPNNAFSATFAPK